MKRYSSLLLVALLGSGLLAMTASAQPPRGQRGNSDGRGHNPSGSAYPSGYSRPGYSIDIGPVTIGVGPSYQDRTYPRPNGYRPYSSNYVAPPVVGRYVPPTVYRESYEESERVPSVARATAETRIEVMVPHPEARVWLDGTLMSSNGTSRAFGFPTEMPGRTYRHKLVAAWPGESGTITQEREVEVAGGTTLVVDFTRPAGTSSAPAPSTPYEEDP